MIWNLGSATRISTMMSTKMTATAKMMIQLMARFVRETMMMPPMARMAPRSSLVLSCIMRAYSLVSIRPYLRMR